MKVDGPQSRDGRFGEEMNLLTLPGIEFIDMLRHEIGPYVPAEKRLVRNVCSFSYIQERGREPVGRY
jgi:hypothetical protein